MFEQMIRQIFKEELSAALRNIPQYADQDRVLDVNEVAELIGRSKSWISSNKEMLPATVYVGSRKWLKSDILQWMEEKKKQTEKVVNFRHSDNTIVRSVKKAR